MNVRGRRLALAILFFASLLLIHRWSGDSPAVWLDTLNDQTEVRACVLDNQCSLQGQGASVSGLFVAGGWLHLRAALFRIGLGLGAVHIGRQVLDAFGVVLVAIAGFELGGAATAGAAAFVLLAVLGNTGASNVAVYNSAPLAFLGAVLLLASVQAVRRPSLWSAASIAMLTAVMADIHTGCVFAGVTAVLVASNRPDRRVAAGALAAIVFAATAFALAPLMWIENARYALAGGHVTGSAPHATMGSWTARAFANPIGVCSMLAVVAWIAAVVTRRRDLRKALDVPVACVAPMWLASLAALGSGIGDAGGKYLAHVKPAAALAAGLLVAEVARQLLAQLPAGRIRRMAPLALVPLAMAATSFSLRLTPLRSPAGFSIMTMTDLEAVAGILEKRHAWPAAELPARVRTQDEEAIVRGLLQETDRGTGAPSGQAYDGDESETATIVKLDTAEVPDPLPPGWVVARRTPDDATLILFDRSVLDWGRAQLCHDSDAGPQCVHPNAGWPTEEDRPWSFQRGHLSLHVPLGGDRPDSAGRGSRVLMPHLADACGGRVVAVPGHLSRIEEDGRIARLVEEPPDTQAGEMILEWNVGAPECPWPVPTPLAPFFVEGDPTSIGFLEKTIARHESMVQGAHP